MIVRNNKRKLFSSALSFEEITSLSHEIAKKVISGKLTKEEAIVEVMNKANWSYDYADAAVSSWIENEPTYNGMVMSSFTLHYKNDDGEDSIWGIYDTKEEAESEIEKFRTTGFGPNPTFCEIIESSRKAIKSGVRPSVDLPLEDYEWKALKEYLDGNVYDGDKGLTQRNIVNFVSKQIGETINGIDSWKRTKFVNSSRKAIK